MNEPISAGIDQPERSAHALPALASQSREVLDALGTLIVALADNEMAQGLHIATWATVDPVFRSAVACAAVGQEKLGRSWVLYALLDELPMARVGLARPTGSLRKRYTLSFFDQPFVGWDQVVATLTIFSPAFDLFLHALSNSAFIPLARQARYCLAEQQHTSAFAEELARDLVALDEGRAMLQRQVDVLLPEVLCWFGPPGEPGLNALVKQGLIKGDATAYRRTFIGQPAPYITNESLRQIYIDQVAPLLGDLGVQTSLRQDEETGLWSYDPLPWGCWNSRRRRLSLS